ncbi:MAG: glycosyltransferase family 2 protein [Saprospiraceae bacterium]|nr:glycosyltransferase family 2 protein [Saprospiraceae bacterium]
MILVDVIIPAFNEENSIGRVIDDIPKHRVRSIIVCNNRSTDHTREVAQKHGAMVVDEERPGYGSACLRGLKEIASNPAPPDVVVFLDGDYSDYPEEIEQLIHPVEQDAMDLVIGSRVAGRHEKGSMTLPQRIGNILATRLIKWIYGYHYTDLGPFRAIRYSKLLELDMQDTTYGWTVEMQVKAAKLRFNCTEIPVRYRKRIGISKISGTLKGTILAGYKIIWTILKLI